MAKYDGITPIPFMVRSPWRVAKDRPGKVKISWSPTVKKQQKDAEVDYLVVHGHAYFAENNGAVHHLVIARGQGGITLHLLKQWSGTMKGRLVIDYAGWRAEVTDLLMISYFSHPKMRDILMLNKLLPVTVETPIPEKLQEQVLAAHQARNGKKRSRYLDEISLDILDQIADGVLQAAGLTKRPKVLRASRRKQQLPTQRAAEEWFWRKGKQ